MIKLLNAIKGKNERLVIDVDDPVLGEKRYITLDAAIEVEHNYEAEATSNPIETGGSVTDHLDVKPVKITINGIVSEAPIKLEAAIAGTVAGAVGSLPALKGSASALVTGGIAALSGFLLNKPDRVKTAYQMLLELQTKKLRCTITTQFQVFKSMLMTSFTFTESAQNGDSLIFNASFQQVQVATETIIDLPEALLDGKVKHTGTEQVDKGTQQPKTPNDAVSGRSSTVLMKMGRLVFGG